LLYLVAKNKEYECKSFHTCSNSADIGNLLCAGEGEQVTDFYQGSSVSHFKCNAEHLEWDKRCITRADTDVKNGNRIVMKLHDSGLANMMPAAVS